MQFYRAQKRQVREEDKVKSITQSIERLIDRELMVGYGVRTPHKWYIHEVKLTASGRREAKKLRGEQQELPLRKFKAQISNAK